MSRAQNQRTSSKKTNHFNSDAEVVLGAPGSKSDRRLKSGHTFTLRSKEPLNLSDEISDESIDFEDVAPPKKTFKSRGSKRGRTSERLVKESVKQVSLESQEFAESASFVSSSNNYKSGYLYDQPIYVPDLEPENNTQVLNVTTPSKSEPEFDGYNYRQQTKTPRKLEPNTHNDSFFATTTVAPSTSSRRGTTTYKNQKSVRFTQDTSLNGKSSSASEDKRISVAYTTARRIQTSRTTPYYTPTVPSIIQRPSTAPQSPRSAFQESSPTTETPPAAEHAFEMMRTLHELNLDTMETSNTSKFPKDSSSLVVPPSSGPDTLHSLALYFATAVDNLVNRSESTTKPDGSDRENKSLDVPFGNVSNVAATLVSNRTIHKYEKLFRLDETAIETATDAKVDNRIAADESNDLDTDYSTNPVLAAAGSPQIRELAQVFTHALSAYLHDPSTFRRVLSEIRPTEPPPLHQNNDIVSNRIGRTEDFNRGSGATYLPTQPIMTATPSNLLPTTEDLEVLDFSDVTVSTLKKDAFYPSTTPSTYPESTTNSPFEVDQTTLTPFSSTNQALLSADRVPASRYLTEQLEKTAQASREAKAFSQTSETKNPIAMEINGGLAVSTSFPYFPDDSLEVNNKSFSDSNYFPVDSDEQINSTERNVYGADFSTGAPIFNSWDKTADYSFPNRFVWDATTESNTAGTTAYPPSALAYELLPPTNNRHGLSLPLGEILPPNQDDNDLQHAQSQSLVASGNQLFREREKLHQEQLKTNYKESSTSYSASGHYITQTIDVVTPSPDQLPRSTLPDTGRISNSAWSTLSYTVFLDPHTINDGLQVALNTVTPSPNTYLPRTTDEPHHSEHSTETNHSEQTRRQGKEYIATTERPQEYMEVMQKKANEMFGNLNDTSASHLMNVMQKANKSKTVRKLILLLIQTCDDDYNTTVEQSRTALLNALIGMDGKLIDDENELQIISSPRRSKSLPSGGPNQLTTGRSTSTETPITTFRRPFFSARSTTSDPQYLFESTSTQSSVDAIETTTFRDYDDYRTTFGQGSGEESTTVGYSTTTPESTTTISTSWSPIFNRRSVTTTASTTTSRSPFQAVTPNRDYQHRPAAQTSSSQSKRIAKDIDNLLVQASQPLDPSAAANRANKFSDTRALDLLRSLYSLAGRFGRR